MLLLCVPLAHSGSMSAPACVTPPSCAIAAGPPVFPPLPVRPRLVVVAEEPCPASSPDIGSHAVRQEGHGFRGDTATLVQPPTMSI